MAPVDLAALIAAREAEYHVLARAVVRRLADLTDPEAIVAHLLIDAYLAGARDMHTAIDDELKPFWEQAGLADLREDR